MHAFTLLERKGLSFVQTRGPFHQNLHDAITQVAEAHFRACWTVVGEVETLAHLRCKSPGQLVHLAEAILKTLASSTALEAIHLQSKNTQDKVLHQSILWNCDVLRYIDLERAMECGDVGIMEETLPHLLYCFAGGNNKRYTIEVLELLQCLQHEWLPELKDFVLHRCWLMNTTGHPLGFLPIDKGQEYNIKDTKVTFGTRGPNASWALMKKTSPAIPALRAVCKHTELQIRTLRRGLHHSDPLKEKDIKILHNAYIASNIHTQQDGREVKTKADGTMDVVTKGSLNILTKGTLARWWNNRSYVQATQEIW
ncbi:hypothetical protein SERLA73DRAFT_56396 [Serpula lacrymans var. lacrymans S7.3]|uniref:DUF6589 domain-containing protein n=1 Tax=Serpula lacrymans var. lacrymans (strain S7.3) TaxID=936435 RepID=F8Q0L8_SERL3|nr:hypothetical protein SERLA73DRAFT_56396 [Serpula lacrymans var. lacrymans S7.3]